MKFSLRWFLICFFGAGLLTQFNNCDIYSDRSTLDSLSSTSCLDENCPEGDQDMLELSTVPSVSVYTSDSGVDLGGDCNEGGFSINQVYWDVIQNSSSIISCSGTGNSCGMCVNGRFKMYVNFGGRPPSRDMQIRVEIKGYDVNNVEYTNPLLASKTIQVRIY
ncbi:MAG: hypothetical protein K1X29_03175 [Bdellovibrionales bacterium]|nr:hypothetical protein [Bdellovibrionales bacterium]